MNNNYALHPSTEIVTAFLSENCANNEALYDSLKSDPVGTIFSLTNVDFSSLKITVVENSASECALVLPYYAEMEQAMSEILADHDLENIAGGEIIVAIGAFFGGIGYALGIGTLSLSAAGYSVTAIAAGAIAVSAATAVSLAAFGGIGAGIGIGIGAGGKEGK